MLTHDSEFRNCRSVVALEVPSEGFPPAWIVFTPEVPSGRTELIRMLALGRSRYGELSLLVRDSPSEVLAKITDFTYVECWSWVDPVQLFDCPLCDGSSSVEKPAGSVRPPLPLKVRRKDCAFADGGE